MGMRRRNGGWLSSLEERAQLDRELRDRLSGDLFPERGSGGLFSLRQVLLALPGIATAIAAVIFVAVLAVVMGDRTTTTTVDTLPTLASSTDPANADDASRSRPQQVQRPTWRTASPPAARRSQIADPPASAGTSTTPDTDGGESTTTPTRTPTPSATPSTTITSTPPRATDPARPPGPPTVELTVTGESSWAVVRELRAGAPKMLLNQRLYRNDTLLWFEPVLLVRLSYGPNVEIKVNGVVQPDDGVDPPAVEFTAVRGEPRPTATAPAPPRIIPAAELGAPSRPASRDPDFRLTGFRHWEDRNRELRHREADRRNFRNAARPKSARGHR